jgi:hypothetical protein
VDLGRRQTGRSWRREIVVLAEVTGQALPAEGVEAAAAFGLAALGQRR